MTEQDYIKATNRVKISAALVICRDVLGGDEYGISEQEMQEIKCLLSNAEAKLFASFELEEGE